ncbi:MAG TPA: hypothetical protein VFJ13_00200 [Paracoccaceae bacterium]|nr:hypothetical protein [Paracoccaceae bacterium]
MGTRTRPVTGPAAGGWTARIACLALALAVAGCVQRYDLEKPDGTIEQERIDWGLCGGDYLPGRVQITTEDSEAVLQCLKDKGYTVAPIGLIQW